jgi:hypothetical protein
MRALAADTHHRDGTRRLVKPRQDEGCAVGRAQASRVRRPARVGVQRPTPRDPVTTESRQGDAVAPNRLARPFGVARPEHVWGGESREVSTLVEGSARPGGGWARRSRSATLGVEDPGRLALGRRQPAAGRAAACGSWQALGHSQVSRQAGHPGTRLS